MEQDDFLKKRIRELANISFQRGIGVFSDFLSLHEQDLALQCTGADAGLVCRLYGGYEAAERQMAGFFPAEDIRNYSGEETFFDRFPLTMIRVEPKMKKYSDTLSHRDYLGAILSLGLDRGVIGDIILEDLGAIVICHEKIAPFLTENLGKIRHTYVTASVLTGKWEVKVPKTSSFSGTVASVRLDTLVSLAFKCSRSEASELITGGLVYVDGRCVVSNSFEPFEGAIISVRHKGRFRFVGIEGNTKKGRIRVELELYG